ncbi:NAD-dependent epimerase/dehydratase family protein [Bradyrhizobium genosp. P]|uniref:NAD-dependent epimerase/dehydratase family protein n=1 Tax=Bradyrhizobium genosp. P TaxID=83641 RepID=UPI003CEF0DB3
MFDTPKERTSCNLNFTADQKTGAGPGTVRVGIVGTGYIADFHANAVQKLAGVELVAVCDQRLVSAEAFAQKWGIRSAYNSLAIMLESQKLDALHVLVPPDFHHSMACDALKTGVHVFLEKPMCVSLEEADDLLQTAKENNCLVAVNHNMLFASAYQNLRRSVHSGDLGPLVNISLDFFQEVGQIRFGPFGSWMLRSPENLALEIGPHVFSIVTDLVGRPDALTAVADRAVQLPGGRGVLRRWRVQMTRGSTSIAIAMNFGPTFPCKTIKVCGQFGTGFVDLDANICVIDQNTTFGVDLDRFLRSIVMARRISYQATRTMFDYVLSKIKIGRRGNPYQTTIIDSVAAFYKGLRDSEALDKRINGESGRTVIDLCRQVIAASCVQVSLEAPKRSGARSIIQPTVLVLGAKGFIGTELVDSLIAAGYRVRAMVRGHAPQLEQMQGSSLEIVRGDISDEKDLIAAMEKVEFVYHLARADVKTWADYVKYDVDPTELVARTCLRMGVKRLIYTGTIDSYYAGKAGATITEATSFGDVGRRNYYARAKAMAEDVLMQMHREAGLPVVILRPGIVLGKGGTPFHWGVGMWGSGNVCQVWGDGNNKLPFVLVGDVAKALVRSIEVPGIEGRTYNLTDVPLLSAREYLDELQRLAGIKIRAYYTPTWRFFIADFAKWLIKLAVGHHDSSRIPSYFDWNSRRQLAVFDCSRARHELGWAPASDKTALVTDGISNSLKPWIEAIA